MSRVAFVLAIGGGLILVSWVTSPAALTEPRPATVTPAEIERADQTVQALAPLTTEIDDQASRLKSRLSQPPPPPQPARNPFTFRGTEPFSTEKAKKGTEPFRPETVEKGYVPLPVAVPALVATTADAGDGGLMRTAVLSMNDELKIVRPGQMFDRFIVELIGPDSVRLVDVTSPTRATFIIAIR